MTSDALGEIARGLEVVEFACSIAHLAKGEYSENVSTGVDVYSLRQPLGVVGIISPFNFPAMVPMWFFPVAIAVGNTVVLKPSREGPERRDLDGAEAQGGRPARRRLQRRARRQGVGRRAARPPRRRVDLVRRLDPDRQVRLRARHPGGQARSGPRRGEEPHARAARRRSRPRRRLGGQRRLRLGGGALHGDLGRRRGRAGRRRADREDQGADVGADRRGRHPRLRHGPAHHARAPRQGRRATSTSRRRTARSSSSTAAA